MSNDYPLVFDSSASTGVKSSLPLPWPFPWSVGPSIGAGHIGGLAVHGGELPYPFAVHALSTVEFEVMAGKESHDFVLASIKGWPETKVEWDERCVKVFGRKICTKVPVLYHRNCTLEVVVRVYYPTGFLNDIENCITGSALAAAVAAVITSGSAAAGTFQAALEACLLAKGAKWADQVAVEVPPPKTDCGPWHPV